MTIFLIGIVIWKLGERFIHGGWFCHDIEWKRLVSGDISIWIVVSLIEIILRTSVFDEIAHFDYDIPPTQKPHQATELRSF